MRTGLHVVSNGAGPALHDDLTHLPNRGLLRDRIAAAYGRRQRSQEPFCLLSVDLDWLEEADDSVGDLEGDDLVREISTRLCRVVRLSDTVARLGANEFAVILTECAADDAGPVLGRIRDALHQAVPLKCGDVYVQATIGVADAIGASGATELIRNAHLAMREGKAAARAVAVFEPEMHRLLTHRIELVRGLRTALAGNEFTLHYQPIFDACSGGVHAFEALIRWQHPERGWVSPAQFIPLAEHRGLIRPIGEWVLDSALRQLAEWRSAGDLDGGVAVAVNFSGRQLTDPGFAAGLEAALGRHGLSPGDLIVEITESLLMERDAGAQDQLQAARELGISISLDDFGTGYSSLARLATLPVDQLKIDRAFISGLFAARHGHALAASVIAMGRALGLRVVAEGVETPEQLAAVRRLRCDLIQGYLLARPMAAEEAVRIEPAADQAAKASRHSMSGNAARPDVAPPPP